MTVVSDTSPISNFFRIGQLLLLKQVYGSIVIPVEVLEELKSLVDFGLNPSNIISQDWIEVKPTFSTDIFFLPKQKIHVSEAAAISLAKELQAKFILIDDRKGQMLALQQNLQPIGTLGTLKIAKEKGIIADVKDSLDKMLTVANYWLSRKVYNDFLNTCKEL